VAHERLAHNNHAHKRIDHTADHNQLHKALMDKLYDNTMDPVAGEFVVGGFVLYARNCAFTKHDSIWIPLTLKTAISYFV
jgi:hypothetical protein